MHKLLVILLIKKQKGRKVFICMAWSLYRSKLSPKGVTTLKKRDGETLKVNYTLHYLSLLKLYVEETTADTGGDTAINIS